MSDRRHHDDERHMTLRDHVSELSRRLLFLVSILLVASSLVYVYRAQVIPVLLQPLELAFGDQKLMYLNPAGGFNFIFFVSIYVGVAVLIPFAIQQLYAFIRPMLPKDAQKLSAKMLLSSFLLLIGGVLFGYYLAVPGALKFLNEFAGEYVMAALTADSYLHFLIAYTIGLGMLFQIPFLLIIGNYIKPFTPGGLLKTERWAIILIVIAAAIITPTPDPVNLAVIALPIIFIYQIGVVAVLIINAKKRRKLQKNTNVAIKQNKLQQKATKPDVQVLQNKTPIKVHVPVISSIPVSVTPSQEVSIPVAMILNSLSDVPNIEAVLERQRPTAKSTIQVPHRQNDRYYVQPPARTVVTKSRTSLVRHYSNGSVSMLSE